MAVERVRAPRTDRGMDAGGWWQKLLKMFPGREKRVSAQGSFWVRLWGRALGCTARRGPQDLAQGKQGPSPSRSPGE